MPESYKLDYQNLKGRSKTPVWHFVGLFVLAVAIVGIIYAGKQTKQKVAKYITSPQVNDIFELRLDDGAFTTAKVKRVAGDTVYFSFNKFQTNRYSGLSDLVKKSDTDYETEFRGILKTTLTQMNAKDEIVDIDRN